MNREEAAGVLSVMRYKLGYVGLIANEEERTAALDVAISYLLAEDNNVPTKQPDTITGLAPCGCGGDAVRNGMSFFCAYVTSCSECGTLAWSKASQQEADNNWNTSRGYTAPPRPGAIGPDAGDMAPNGDEGAES